MTHSDDNGLVLPPHLAPIQVVIVPIYKNAEMLAKIDEKVAKGATVLTTDVWTSMGQEEEYQKRLNDFDGFIIDEALMALADKDAIFLHCLPAHRGEEVSEGVLEGAQSHVWQEAENRLHVQKGIMVWLEKHKRQ